MTLEGGETVCRACLYPEVVLRDKNGKAHYSRSVVFALDAMDFLPKEQTQVCTDCKRTVKRGESRLCSLCEAIDGRKNLAGARALYKKYSSALPVATRLAAIGKTKLCYEDSQTIVFLIGGTDTKPPRRYQLEKLSLLTGKKKHSPTEMN